LYPAAGLGMWAASPKQGVGRTGRRAGTSQTPNWTGPRGNTYNQVCLTTSTASRDLVFRYSWECRYRWNTRKTSGFSGNTKSQNYRNTSYASHLLYRQRKCVL